MTKHSQHFSVINLYLININKLGSELFLQGFEIPALVSHLYGTEKIIRLFHVYVPQRF